MSGSALVVALLLGAQAPAPSTPARPAPSRPGLSWEEADSVTRVLHRIDRRLRSGRPASKDTIVVTEGQVNSFVNLTLAEEIPPEMSDLEIDLRQDRLGARGRLDLDQLRAKMPPGGPASLAGHRDRPEGGEAEAQLGFLVEAHRLRRVILIAHAPCAYYGQKLGLAPEAADRVQRDDLARGARRVRRLGAVRVDTYLATVVEGRVRFNPI